MWHSPDFFKELLDSLYDGVYFVNRDRIITYWNKGAERISGYTADEVMGFSCRDNILVHMDSQGRMLCIGRCPLEMTMRDGRERQAEVYLHHKDGHRVPVLVKAAPIRDRSGELIGAVEIFSDNSARIADLEKITELEQKAFIDPLTGLPNRRFLEKTLLSSIEEMSRYAWGFGVLFLDVDHFKHVNDRYGHDVGDDVLKMVAKTMVSCSRAFDIVGRWGGEEFVAVIINTGREDVLAIAERYRHLIGVSALSVGGEQLRVSVSVGATLAGPGDTIDALLKRADELMYRSKLAGRNRVSSDVLPDVTGGESYQVPGAATD